MKWPSSLTYGLIGAAALALLGFIVFFPGAGGGKAPNGKMFAYIPGHGIVENNNKIRYVLSDGSSAENAEAAVTIESVIATEDQIKITVELARKGVTEEQAIEQLESSDRKPLHATLRADHFPSAGYEARGGGGGGALFSDFTFTFDVRPDDIKTGATYRFDYDAYGLSLDFKLKEYESFDSPDQIGPTAAHNNISITAVPVQKNGVLMVDLYPINKGRYRIESFFHGERGYRGQDLRLETSSGVKKYTTPRSGYSPPNTRFFFDVSPNDKDLVLQIPYILVKTDESRTVKLKVPATSGKIVINEKVEFDDATMTIVDVEKTVSSSSFGELVMTLKYDNKRPNMVMQSAEFDRVNFLGIHAGAGGYGATIDDQGVYATFSVDLEKDESSVRLRIFDPVYYLTDGYRLKLDK